MPAPGPPIGPAPDPPALSQYVLKVHSRCDLACDHCYVYQHADQSWRGRPATMAPATVRAAARRIAQHAARHNLRRVTVVLHGGEPLLVGAGRLGEICADLRAAISPVTHLDLRMQTNGVLLSEAICDVLGEHGVRVGVSLDGDRAANDRHRRYASGASSHDGALRALALLRRPEYRHLYAGILCTVDVANDPIAVYEALLAERPPRIDFLLPHATWDRPPPRPDGEPAPYGRWLLRVHERWEADGRPVAVRIFDSLLAVAAGGSSGTEALGIDPVDLAVIETDGAWEQVDSVKVAYEGAPATGLDVFTNAVDDVAAHPAIAQRQAGIAALCDTCRACPVVKECGGGLYPHRYRSGSGFANPSVYCADLKELIVTMAETAHSEGTADGTAGGAAEPAGPIAELPDEIFDRLATGYGDEAAVRHLAAEEAAITRALVAHVAADAPPAGPAAEAWSVLVELDRDAPDAVAETFAHPYVRVWAAAVVGGAGRSAEHAYLDNLAVVAAQRAGREVDLPVPVVDGRVHLPAVGALAVPARSGATARVGTGPDGYHVRCAGQTTVIPSRHEPNADGWRPVRTVALGERDVLLDDLDPYRDCFDWPAGAALGPTGVAAWSRSLAAAWRMIRDDAPELAAGVGAGLRTITPLRVDPDGGLRSAATRHAFGAVGIAPAGGTTLAMLLVHEFQHNKLAAVIDLCDLFDPAYRPRVRVGWRPDPRPVDGALHGAYAHLGMARLWRPRATTPNSGRARAEELFRTYRDWTARAIDALVETGALTPNGSRFVGGMAATLAAWSP